LLLTPPHRPSSPPIIESVRFGYTAAQQKRKALGSDITGKWEAMTDLSDRYEELSAAETSARANAHPVLQRFVLGFSISDRVLREYATELEARAQMQAENPCLLAHRYLLPRLADDLRCVWHLAADGYWLQALTLSGSAVETWATIGYVAWNDGRAERWLEWQRLEKTPWSVASMIDGAVAAWRGQAGGQLARGMQRWYTLVCMAKHANPRLQLRSLGALTPADHAIATMPEVTPKTHHALFITLYKALELTWYTCGALFAGDNAELPPQLLSNAQALGDAMTKIASPS
jgi:hypothetical protein